MTGRGAMAGKHLGAQGRRTAWCVWFALLMGAPYAPLAQVSPTSAVGPSSLSKLFAWVALGIALGLWFGSHPKVARIAAISRRMRRAVVVAGIATTAIFLMATILNVVFCLFAAPDGAGTWGVISAGYPLSSALRPVVTSVLKQGAVFGATAGFLCGWSGRMARGARPARGGASSEISDDGGLSEAELWGARPGAGRGGRAGLAWGRGGVAALGALGLLLGFLQPLAWTLLLPHSPFPQPVPLVVPAGADGVWDAATLGPLVMALPIPAVLMMAFSLVTTGALSRYAGHPNGEGRPCRANAVLEDSSGASPLVPVAALCLGVLGFRVISRVAPGLYATPLWLAAGALSVYAVLFAVTMLVGMRACGWQVGRDTRGKLRWPARRRGDGATDREDAHNGFRWLASGEERGVGGKGLLDGTCDHVDGTRYGDGDAENVGLTSAPAGFSDAREGTRLRAAGELRNALSPQAWALLAQRGLTEQETLVVCAHACGLTSARAGSLMGVAEPTVREYRRRARRKLGVETLDGALAMLPAGSVVSAPRFRIEFLGEGHSDAISSDHVAACGEGVEGASAGGRETDAAVCVGGDADGADVSDRWRESGAAVPGSDDENVSGGSNGPRAKSGREARVLRAAATVALCCLSAAAALVLLPCEGAVCVWSDTWTTAFGVGVGRIGEWAWRWARAALPVGRRGRTGRVEVLVAAFGLLIGVAALVVVRRETVPALALDGDVRRMVILFAMVAVVACLSALCRRGLSSARTVGVDGACAFALAALSIGVALVASQAGVGLWSMVLVCATAVGTMLVVGEDGPIARTCSSDGVEGAPADGVAPIGRTAAARGTMGPRLAASGDVGPGVAPDLCWLAAAALFAWMGAEVWHAQGYDSLLGVLQWGVLALFVITAYREVRIGTVGPLGVALLVCVGVLGWAVAGLGAALIACGLLLVLAWPLLRGGAHGDGLSAFDEVNGTSWPVGGEGAARSLGMRAGLGCEAEASSWHAPSWVMAFGLVAGPLISAALGDAAGGRVLLPDAGGVVTLGALVSFLLVGVFVLVAVACLMNVERGEAISLALSQRERVRARLSGMGLSERQIDVALLLAGGHSVLEVAGELSYSRSTIVAARRDIYRTLGIQTREELVAYLRALARDA